MKLSEFGYSLPKDLIAQHPLPERSQSRLMLVDRKTGRLEHRFFSDLPRILIPSDVLVLNNTKVFPARLEGVVDGSARKIEILLLKEIETNTWETLVKPSKRVPLGSAVRFEQSSIVAQVLKKTPSGKCILKFVCQGDFEILIDALGRAPLPPYIKRADLTDDFIDHERYQTVYAKVRGSVAAPTAGLHFTEEILDALSARGVQPCYITLHVGYGTFKPVRAENVEDHQMEPENYDVSQEAADLINTNVNRGGRIIAVGTTSARTLEHLATIYAGRVVPERGVTNLFIYPGYNFKLISGLLTNFHLPHSTLLMLVCAFAGKDLVMHCYQEAIRERYRFYSYGDCMLVL